MSLATENLYLAAFARTSGAALRRVVVSRTNGRDTAVFELDCAWAEKLLDDWDSGTATVNIGDYRRHLEELKDELFGALREIERRQENANARPRSNQRRRSTPRER